MECTSARRARSGKATPFQLGPDIRPTRPATSYRSVITRRWEGEKTAAVDKNLEEAADHPTTCKVS